MSAALLTALKRALKSKGVTYKELAEELGLSESGVKKMLTAKDLSLSRLMEICDWLGVPASDLVRLAEKEDIREVELSDEQSRALAADPLLFRLFWRLLEQEGLLAVARAEGLTAAQMKKHLLKLESLELLRVNADGRVRLRHRGLYRWKPGNPLVDRLNREWSRLTLDRVLKAPPTALSVHRLSALKLTEGSIRELIQGMNELADEFARRARREELIWPAARLKFFGLLLAGIDKRFIDSDL
ncbi:MAG: helix-turn-helix transcriptional regulator [Bdellovibrionaceae bacterium]|nr:helix-turn-helix transcriptional regulator [Pseudobdellovibrionaceae bacterium]MBX3034600.1 helix-turn-helix transcriptional regulator [Pseudobdellovibrionaceae bacterium]